MDGMFTIIVLAITVEAVVEYGKLLIKERRIVWPQVAALFLGVSLSILAGTDLYATIGVSFAAPIVGMVLTGLLFSRGANYISDLVKRMQGHDSAAYSTGEFDDLHDR